ncbi:rab6a-gef complex partner protein [Anaeramoeba flamelloides]|uniref:Rab6a-gef complex partner protein n=1 Tax=Anaeramoeba flamelloides TaxID=1746091 RepID=A0AAV7YYP6_9EUKA|nr:rab6a-gef complex partner protein [Anaeramoeba flamelloides]
MSLLIIGEKEYKLRELIENPNYLSNESKEQNITSEDLNKFINEIDRPLTFNISQKEEQIAILFLNDSVYQLGDVIYGWISFPTEEIEEKLKQLEEEKKKDQNEKNEKNEKSVIKRLTKCLSVSLTLETEETFIEELIQENQELKVYATLMGEFFQFTYYLSFLPFYFQIPLDSAQFISDMVTLDWFLNCEFTITNEEEKVWRKKSSHSSLKLQIPLQIHSPSWKN